ncbi:MAG: DUF6442 family protein [Erysipelotrichaceae bacterium]|nr:DUF6442 family protein [Erysipelotrichaceae bacterium]
MDKEEILRKSQNEYKNGEDEMDQYEYGIACKWALIVGTCLMVVLLISNTLYSVINEIPGPNVSGIAALYCAMMGTIFVVKNYKHKNKVFVIGVIEIMFTLFFLILYFQELFG